MTEPAPSTPRRYTEVEVRCPMGDNLDGKETAWVSEIVVDGTCCRACGSQVELVAEPASG